MQPLPALYAGRRSLASGRPSSCASKRCTQKRPRGSFVPHLAADSVVVSLQNGFNELTIPKPSAASAPWARLSISAQTSWSLASCTSAVGARWSSVSWTAATPNVLRACTALYCISSRARSPPTTSGATCGARWATVLCCSPARSLRRASLTCSTRAMRGRSLTALAREVMAVAAAEGVTPMGFNGYDPAAFGANGTAAAIDVVVRRHGRVQSPLGKDAQRRMARHCRSPSQNRMRCAVCADSEAGAPAGYCHSSRERLVLAHARSRERGSPAGGGKLGRLAMLSYFHLPGQQASKSLAHSMQIRFDDRTAIVTGAAHGFGRNHRAELCDSRRARGGVRRAGGRARRNSEAGEGARDAA